MADGWLDYLQSVAPDPPATPVEVFEHYKQGLSAKHGFWGHVDSGVDWCEFNYHISPYIAEFFNTLSSFPMIIWSVAGAYLSYRYASKELPLIVCFLGLGVVGFGSALFHATLRYYAQLLDEIPMLLEGMLMLYTLIEIHKEGGIHSLRDLNYPLMLGLMLVTGIVIYLYVASNLWFIFLGYYASQIFTMIGVCLMYVPRSSLSFRMFLSAAIVYFVAWCLWLTDLYLCNEYQAYQLHSLWHIGAGYGSYLAIMVLQVERLRFLNQSRKKKLIRGSGLHFSGFLIPYYVNHSGGKDNDINIHVD